MTKKIKSIYRLVETTSPGFAKFTTIPNDQIAHLPVRNYPFQIVILKKAKIQSHFATNEIESISGRFFPNATLTTKDKVMDQMLPGGILQTNIRDFYNWNLAVTSDREIYNFNLEKDQIVQKNDKNEWECVAPQSLYPRQNIIS